MPKYNEKRKGQVEKVPCVLPHPDSSNHKVTVQGELTGKPREECSLSVQEENTRWRISVWITQETRGGFAHQIALLRTLFQWATSEKAVGSEKP